MKGLIFDIKRFATHDGSGIRTTVFLKGCNLKCIWCQNPEGISLKREPLFFKNRCIGCKLCISESVDEGMTLKDGEITMNASKKEEWDEIADCCPACAIEMDSKEMSVDEVINEVLRDRVFFKYGGGVTLSGGEPFVQWEFAIELLKRLKEEGIHTAVETALNIDSEILKKVLPYIDAVYADMKIFDSENHKKYTGVSNEKIKKNIEYLLTGEQRENVVIRTPMIPEYTAIEDNIFEIGRYISTLYPEVKYEILNYNPLAEGKYETLNKKYCFEENPSLYTKEQMKNFGETAEKGGVKNIIIES